MISEKTRKTLQHLVISHCAINESIIDEITAYNDVMQTDTYMAFTPYRIFYWHSSGVTQSLKVKSYNLIQMCTFATEHASIHFNDEIIKFVVANDSEEMLILKTHLSQWVSKTTNTPNSVSKWHKRFKRKESSSPKFKIETPGPTTSKVLKNIIMVAIVVALSFLGTVSFIRFQEWRELEGQEHIMTEAKLREIDKNIRMAETRMDNLMNAQQIIRNQRDWLNTINTKIEPISPSDIFFDWEYLRGSIASSILSLEVIRPKDINDEGPYFLVVRGGIDLMLKTIHQRMEHLTTNTVEGINLRFTPASLLVDVRQDILAIQTMTDDKIAILNTEADRVQTYLEQQQKRIQR